MAEIVKQLGMTWSEVWVTVVTATGIYVAMIFFSRVFGQRHLASSSSYDLAFIFAIGSLVGRVVLVGISLPADCRSPRSWDHPEGGFATGMGPPVCQ